VTPMSPDVTIKISFGGEGASVAVSPATDEAPTPMSIEELHAGRSAGAALPRPSDELAGLEAASLGAPAPLPIEELLAGSQSGTPTPQPAGAPQAGDPPGPMPIEQLGPAGATSVPTPTPEAPKTTARRRSPSTR
jgi:hypothetical protein